VATSKDRRVAVGRDLIQDSKAWIKELVSVAAAKELSWTIQTC
jgi:hypothetical protein